MSKSNKNRTGVDAFLWAIAAKKHGIHIANKLNWSIENNKLIGRNDKGNAKITTYLPK